MSITQAFALCIQRIGLTGMYRCFRKCITSKITAGKLDRSEEPCMQNCVDRFMDANLTVIRHLEQMRSS